LPFRSGLLVPSPAASGTGAGQGTRGSGKQWSAVVGVGLTDRTCSGFLETSIQNTDQSQAATVGPGKKEKEESKVTLRICKQPGK